jgi:plastocyanin
MTRTARGQPMILPAWLAALALLLAACAPAATEPTPAPTPTPTPAPEDEPTPTPAPTPTEDPNDEPDDSAVAPATTETVEIIRDGFEPRELTISAGTSVRFVNQDTLAHTATHGHNGAPDEDPLFDERLARDDTATVTFDRPGTYQVTCRFHPTMNMTITVTD